MKVHVAVWLALLGALPLMSHAAGRSGPDRNKEAIRRVVSEVMHQGNLAVIDELFAPDFQNHTAPPGLPPTRDGFKQLVASVRGAFPDVAPEIDELIVDGDTVVMRDHATGTHKGPFLGAPATSKKATWGEIHIWRFKNGKIAEHWSQEDLLGLMMQLGLVPPPPAK